MKKKTKKILLYGAILLGLFFILTNPTKLPFYADSYDGELYYNGFASIEANDGSRTRIYFSYPETMEVIDGVTYINSQYGDGFKYACSNGEAYLVYAKDPLLQGTNTESTGKVSTFSNLGQKLPETKGEFYPRDTDGFSLMCKHLDVYVAQYFDGNYKVVSEIPESVEDVSIENKFQFNYTTFGIIGLIAITILIAGGIGAVIYLRKKK